jgi:hypothetical protein
MIHEPPQWMLWTMISVSGFLMMLPALRSILPPTISFERGRRGRGGTGMLPVEMSTDFIEGPAARSARSTSSVQTTSASVKADPHVLVDPAPEVLLDHSATDNAIESGRAFNRTAWDVSARQIYRVNAVLGKPLARSRPDIRASA